MRKEEREALAAIQLVQRNQGLLLGKPESPQQELFQLYGQRHLLQQKMMHRQLEYVLDYLPGTLAHNALYTLYLGLCLQMKIQLNPEDHPLLRKLIQWSDMYPALLKQPHLCLIEMVAPVDTITALYGYQQYITFLNFIGADLVKVIRRTKLGEQRTGNVSFDHLKAEDLLQFLLNSTPKVLFNIILPRQVLPPQFKENSIQVLYRATDLQFFVRSKPFYATLLKILLRTLVQMQLKPSQQKTMMEVVFRYFYAFHHDKKYASTDIFIEAFNALSQSVRFAMADQFVLFFRVIKKIGKHHFCDFLLSKSEWLKVIDKKVAEGNYVGYAKETLNPFPSIRITDSFTVGNGKVEHRTFEVLQDYSLFYFLIEVVSQDITIRLNYLGDFEAEQPCCIQLLSYEKRKGTLKANIMAAKKGIYQFEFDNSYSWLSSKTVRLQKIVLMPLQFRSPGTPEWLFSYYENLPLNKMFDQSKVYQIAKRQAPLSSSNPQLTLSEGNITKAKGFFNMRIRRGTNLYEFESKQEDRLVSKFNQISELGGKIRWMVDGELLEDSRQLSSLLRQQRRGGEREQERNGAEQRRHAGKEVVPIVNK